MLRFANHKCGWVLGGGRQLLRTSDGGSSWSNRYPPFLDDPYIAIRTLWPLNCEKCWFLAQRVSNEVRCFSTDNAGSEWTQRYIFFSEKYRILHLDLCFSDPMHGWILCGEVQGRAAHPSIHLTSDGGNRWTRVPLKLKGELGN